MNCSRRSSGSRSRLFRSILWRTGLLAALAAAAGIGGCQDDLTAPSSGVLEVILTSPTAGGYDETRVTMAGGDASDSVLIAAATTSRHEFILPAGTVVLTAAKECARIGPEASLEVTIPRGGRAVAQWSVEPGSAIEVVSNLRGAVIRLDGAPTGRVTPATLACIEPGSHTVSVSLLGAEAAPGADTIQTVIVGTEPVRAEFNLAPEIHPRTALLEIFTATYCPNCAPADAAATLLWEALGPAQGYIGLQVHTRWGGRDSLATPTTLARNALYGDQERLGIPAAIIGGTILHRGAGGLDAPAIAEIYRASVEQVKQLPSPFAFHWSAADLEPEVAATGRVRLMLTEAATDTSLKVWAAVYKDDLRTIGIEGPNQEFRHNVREFQLLGSLGTLGLASSGDYADLEPAFALGWDRRKPVPGSPIGSVWSEAHMGLVVFVQNMTTLEIFQASHRALRTGP